MSAIQVHSTFRKSTKNVGFSFYPDGSPRIEDQNLSEDYDTLVLRPTSMGDLAAGLYFADAAADRGLDFNRLVLGFIPGARQDRKTDGAGSDYLLTAKSVAGDINARGFHEVVLIDPHSDVISSLIERSRVVTQADIFANYWGVFLDDSETVQDIRRGNKIARRLKIDGVIAPDAGAAKKAFDVAAVLGVPLYQAFKHRDPATGKLSGFSIEGLHGDEHYLLVDDICDGGGTFLGLADEIKQEDTQVSLFVTHGIFSKGIGPLTDTFVKVFTTDTTLFNTETDDHFTRLNIMEKILND